jgi:hypothetical protein
MAVTRTASVATANGSVTVSATSAEESDAAPDRLIAYARGKTVSRVVVFDDANEKHNSTVETRRNWG